MNDTRALATTEDRRNIVKMRPDELAKELRPMFPDDIKSEQQALAIARVAIAYGLDPVMGELVPFQGRPYVTIEGMIRVADRFAEYDGFDDEPASQDEYRALQAEDGEVIWKCFVFRKDRRRPVKAYGRAGGPNEKNALVRGDTRAGKVVTAAHMARKRAIHAALRMTFPKALPEELIEGITGAQNRMLHAVDQEAGVTQEQRRVELREVFDVESSAELTKDQATAYIDGRLVDAATGEIIEPEAIFPVDDPAEPDTRPINAVGLRDLGELLNKAAISPEKRDAMLEKYFGHRELKALTRDDAARLRNMLMGMIELDGRTADAAEQRALVD